MAKLILGLLLVSLSVYYLYSQALVLSFTSVPNFSAPIIRLSPPASITIERSQIHIPIEPGEITKGVWKISSDSATYLTTGAYPGEKGNMIIYGHNTDHVFGKLSWVQKGDVVEITAQDSKQFKYKVHEIRRVNPTQVEILTPTNYPQLTIFTCIGLFDSQRLVVIAQPEL